jgi:hypothetical protein
MVVRTNDAKTIESQQAFIEQAFIEQDRNAGSGAASGRARFAGELHPNATNIQT